ncbi:MAG: hypothetical protein L0H73_12550 [Nitrococcus sp.]|nr:hypothetical protein [Nitrococcus sp.]
MADDDRSQSRRLEIISASINSCETAVREIAAQSAQPFESSVLFLVADQLARLQAETDELYELSSIEPASAMDGAWPPGRQHPGAR